jgi:hypothetical protein
MKLRELHSELMVLPIINRVSRDDSIWHFSDISILTNVRFARRVQLVAATH